MKKESGRPILLEGKKVFASAAIATLLVQPLYILLSSGVAFAATEEDNVTILNETVSTSLVVNGNRDDSNADTNNPIAIGSVNGLNPESNYTIGHTFTIDTPSGQYTPDPITSSSASQDLTVDTYEYGDGEYIITYEAAYTEVTGEAEPTNPTTLTPITENFTVRTIPTVTISEDLSDIRTSYHIEITSTPGVSGEEITLINARVYTNDANMTLINDVSKNSTELQQDDNSWSARFEFDELNPGDYYVLYSAESTNPGEETPKTTGDLRKEFSIPQETTTPEEPADPTDPQNPEEPQNPAPVDPDLPESPEYEAPADEGFELAPENPEALPEEEEGDDENNEDDEDITETALGIAIFSTGLVGNADPFFTEIIGGRTIPVDNGNDSSNEEENSIKAPTAGDVINKNETDEKGVAKFLGIAWYWWVAMIAGAASLWSLVIAGRNRMTGGDL